MTTDKLGNRFRRAGDVFRVDSPVAETHAHEQLGWLLQFYAEHCGADFSLLLHFVEGEQKARLLAECSNGQTSLAAERDSIIDAISAQAFRRDAISAMRRQSLESEGQTLQLSALHFNPAKGVEIVAVSARLQASSTVVQDLSGARVRPLLEGSLRLWWLHERERRRATVFRQALDVNDLGVVLLNRRGNLLFANAFAERLMSEGDGLQLHDTTLGCNHADDLLRLMGVVQFTIMSGRMHPGQRSRWPASMVSLRRRSRRPLLVTLLHVDYAAVEVDDPAVIVYVVDPELDIRRMLAPVCRMFKLTAAEGRLAAELVSGASLAEAAEAINVRPHTARGYLKQIFGKTETNRQVDLVRLMLCSAARSNARTDTSLL